MNTFKAGALYKYASFIVFRQEKVYLFQANEQEETRGSLSFLGGNLTLVLFLQKYTFYGKPYVM